MRASRSRSAMRVETKPPPEGGGETSRTDANQGVTRVVAEEVLFVGFGSDATGATVAVLEIEVPAEAVRVTVIEMLADPPGPI